MPEGVEIVHRAIRDTIECTLCEHSIVMNRSCAAFGLEFCHSSPRHSQNAAALLSAACAAPFAHRLALPSWRPTVRFSCKHEICLQNPTSELLYRKMYKKREKFLKKSLAILQGLLYTTKCCDMIAKKHKVAATENT